MLRIAAFGRNNDPSTTSLTSSPYIPKKPSGYSGSDPTLYRRSSSGASQPWSAPKDHEILDDSKLPGAHTGGDKAPYDFSKYDNQSPTVTKKTVDDTANLQDYAADDDMDAILAQLAADDASSKSQKPFSKPSSPVMPKLFTGQQMFGGNAGQPQGIPQNNPFNQAPLAQPGVPYAAGGVNPVNQGQGINAGLASPPSSPKFVHKHHGNQGPVIDAILRPLVDVEGKIVNLKNDLVEQRDILQALMAEAGGVDSDDLFTDEKATISNLEDQLDSALEKYPAVFKDYLFNRFSQYGNGKETTMKFLNRWSNCPAT